MKKIVLVALLLTFSSTVYAVDFNSLKQKAVKTVAQQSGIEVQTNLKQKQVEKDYPIDDLRVYFHYKVIQQDKLTYDEDNTSETLYGELLDLIKKNETLYTQQTVYLEKTKKLFDEIANCENENIPTAEQFNKKKIIIYDKDFDTLDKDLKTLIFMLNTY